MQQPQSQTTTSLFGQPATSAQQQQPTTSIFSQHAATGTQQTTGTSLFGQPAQQQQKPATSLFSQPATGTQQGTTSIFGQPAAGTQQQQPSASLFGQPAGGTQQQPQSTPFFMGGAQTAGTQSSSMPLFGQPATGTQPSTTSLFGQPAGTAQQPQGTLGSSLFNSTTQPSTTTIPTTGLFGPTQAQSMATGTNLFGSPFPATGTLFGAQRQPSISPIQPTGSVLFSKATKFNDLPEEIRRKFESLDAHIQGRLQISNDLKQRKLGQEPTKGQDLIREVHKELLNVAATIQSDALFTKDLKEKTDQGVQDTIIATRIVDGVKNPQQYGVYLKNHATFPLEFFTRVTKQMQQRLQWYKNTIDQIERKLSSTAAQAQTTPQVIASTLQTQHATFVSLAAKTAAADAELQKVKALYTQLWRAKTGSMRDPFNDLDRGSGGDFGMDPLRTI
ncbi:hypothetical protein JVU11DRAFT_3918 [Chiua virens]|nr:hypothetical protein JVU11DRAFT_3918 [Chiua virens]